MDINNLFNNNYEQAFMYSSMGRNINIGIKNLLVELFNIVYIVIL